ncbi:MAG TPA: SH3 domain-containing protein [Elusimicrobiota bacterium]|nr:SH3 domain-containing protein [Elusimicrobiota bacterium]
MIWSFCLAASHAETAEETFRKANSAYAAGQFAQAADLYRTARQAGLNHWILDYNLGNAEYKNNQPGKAIADYSRAFRLNSGNADVVYNLHLVSTRAGDPLVPAGALAAVFWRMYYLFSLNTLSVIVSILFLALVARLGGWLLGGARPASEALAGLLGALVIAGAWLGSRAYFAERPEGVIIGGVGEVRSAPNTSSPANFTVPEGHRVLILDEQEPVTGWVEIGVPEQGLKGWVADGSIEKI